MIVCYLFFTIILLCAGVFLMVSGIKKIITSQKVIYKYFIGIVLIIIGLALISPTVIFGYIGLSSILSGYHSYNI